MDTKTRNIIMIMGGVGLFAGAVYVFMYTAIQNTTQEMETLRADIQAIETQAQEGDSVSDVLRDTSEKRRQLMNYLVSSEETVEFINFIERLGSTHGVEVNTNAVDVYEGDDDAVYENAHIERVRMDITLKGSKERLITYIDLLETVPYKIVFDEVRIQETEERWEGDVILRVYTHI